MSAPKARKFGIADHEAALSERETKSQKKSPPAVKILLYIPVGLLCLFAIFCLGYMIIGSLTAS